MIGYIDETVMRIREPLLLVKQNLEDLAGRVDDIPAGSGILQAELQVEAQRLAQIFENLLDIQRAIAEGREEIPESYKAFITRE